MGSRARGLGLKVGRSGGSAARCWAVESVIRAVRLGTSSDLVKSGERSRVQVQPVGQVAEGQAVAVATSAQSSCRPVGRRSAGRPQAAGWRAHAVAGRVAPVAGRRSRFRSGRSGGRRQQGRSRPGAEVQPGPGSSGAARATSARSWVSEPVLRRGGRRRSRRARVARVPAGGDSVAGVGGRSGAGRGVGRGSRSAQVATVAEVGRGRRSRRSGPGSREGRMRSPGPGQVSRRWVEGGMDTSGRLSGPGSRGVGLRPRVRVHPGRWGRREGYGYARACVAWGCGGVLVRDAHVPKRR